MKLGFVSATLAELSLEDVLAFASEAGFDSVELMCWPRGKAERRYAGVTHLDVNNFDVAATQALCEKHGVQISALGYYPNPLMCWPKGKAERRYAGVTHLDVNNFDVAATQALCEKHGVQISALGYYPNPLCADEAEAQIYIAHLKKVIDAASALGIGQVNTFLGRDPQKSIEDNWPRFLAVWPGIVQHAEQQKVRIGIENCPMYFSHDEWPSGKNLAISPSVWRKMFAAIPSESFGLNYDPSHLVWQFMDYIAPLREFSGRLFHIHAKDVRIDRHRLNDVGITATPLEFHLPKIPGLGEIEWGRFFSVLGDVGYRGHVVIEVEDRAYEHSLEGRKAALRQSLRFLKNFV